MSKSTAVRRKTASPPGDFDAFWTDFWQFIPEQDQSARSQYIWKNMAAGLLDVIHRLGTKKNIVEIRNLTAAEVGLSHPVTGVFMAMPDMPFVIQTLYTVLQSVGWPVRLSVHPEIVGHLNKQESWQVVDRDKSKGEIRPLAVAYIEINEIEDRALRAKIEKTITAALNELYAVNKDQDALLQQRDQILDNLANYGDILPKPELAEARAFLNWLTPEHFTFLGYRRYDYQERNNNLDVRVHKGAGLGLLRDDNWILAEEQTLMRGGRNESVGSSRVDLQACKLEYSIVSPK